MKGNRLNTTDENFMGNANFYVPFLIRPEIP